MANIKELSRREDRLAGGHRLCAGCGASIAVRQILLGAGIEPLVAGCATGCLEVSTTIYPYTSWKTPFIHNAFENSAATISGVEAAFKGLKAAGKIPADKRVKFVAFGGDGGTYDIGLQSLSGAMERGHDMVYVCYDNGAYMNTGIQRSSATPFGAWATTAEVGKAQQGKTQRRKDLTSIIAAHGVPYVAQGVDQPLEGPHRQGREGVRSRGPGVHQRARAVPARLAHRTRPTPCQIAKSAVQTGFWPCFEVEDGEWRMTVNVRERKPIEEFLKTAGPLQAPLQARERRAARLGPGRGRPLLGVHPEALQLRLAQRSQTTRTRAPASFAGARSLYNRTSIRTDREKGHAARACGASDEASQDLRVPPLQPDRRAAPSGVRGRGHLCCGRRDAVPARDCRPLG